MFLPILVVAVAGRLFHTPSTLHGVRWMFGSFLKPSPTDDDSWMPMAVALDVVRGPRASELFQVVFFERQIKFQYPPSSLLPLEPLAWLDALSPRLLNGLNSVIVLLNAALVALLAWRLFRPRSLEGEGLPDRRWVALLAGAAALVFYPVVQAHNIGQIQTWIDLLFTGACLLWLQGRRALAGAAIGLACALKPQFALFLPWALVFRRWDFALGLVGCLLPIGVASLVRYGVANHVAYLEVLAHLSRHGESFQFNQSINGLMHRLLFNGCNICPPSLPTPLPPFHPVVRLATMAATLAFLALSFVPAWIRRAQGPTLLDFSVAGMCFTMASPVAWYHHYGIALPLFVVAFHSALREPEGRSRRIVLGSLGAAWFLSANYIGPFNRLADTLWNPTQSHLFFGALLLLWVLVRQARREAVLRT